jgi:hypothetical protein
MVQQRGALSSSPPARSRPPPPTDHALATSLESSLGSPMPELRQFLNMTSLSPREATAGHRCPPPLPRSGPPSPMEQQQPPPPQQQPLGSAASEESSHRHHHHTPRSAAAALSRQAGALSRDAAVEWARRRWDRSYLVTLALVGWRTATGARLEVRRAQLGLLRLVRAWSLLARPSHNPPVNFVVGVHEPCGILTRRDRGSWLARHGAWRWHGRVGAPARVRPRRRGQLSRPGRGTVRGRRRCCCCQISVLKRRSVLGAPCEWSCRHRRGRRRTGSWLRRSPTPRRDPSCMHWRMNSRPKRVEGPRRRRSVKPSASRWPSSERGWLLHQQGRCAYLSTCFRCPTLVLLRRRPLQ